MVSITWIVKTWIKGKIWSIEIIGLITLNYNNYNDYNIIEFIEAIKNRKFTIFPRFSAKIWVPWIVLKGLQQ